MCWHLWASVWLLWESAPQWRSPEAKSRLASVQGWAEQQQQHECLALNPDHCWFLPMSPAARQVTEWVLCGTREGEKNSGPLSFAAARNWRGWGRLGVTSRGRWLVAQGPIGSFRSWPALASRSQPVQQSTLLQWSRWSRGQELRQGDPQASGEPPTLCSLALKMWIVIKEEEGGWKLMNKVDNILEEEKNPE